MLRFVGYLLTPTLKVKFKRESLCSVSEGHIILLSACNILQGGEGHNACKVSMEVLSTQVTEHLQNRFLDVLS
jgi:hypothetical protein